MCVLFDLLLMHTCYRFGSIQFYLMFSSFFRKAKKKTQSHQCIKQKQFYLCIYLGLSLLSLSVFTSSQKFLPLIKGCLSKVIIPYTNIFSLFASVCLDKLPPFIAVLEV